ncbi:helix-turn-helix domain-containing protein [Pseudofrankia sp. BMG5.36]|uniref:helix-turn-helix domain-containing protein n=1 Tax=Pseudofrankia sp. BMG5.36 TaxID=1834512 RepID=UPI0032D5A6D4
MCGGWPVVAFDEPRDHHRDLSADPVETTARLAQAAPAADGAPGTPEVPADPASPEAPAGPGVPARSGRSAVGEVREPVRGDRTGGTPAGAAREDRSEATPAGGAQEVDDGGSVGARLARARVAAGMSVDEVSARTRIRATLIRQIEQDDFSGVGGAVYARGHIRGIARTLDIAPESLIAAYDASHERVPAPSLAPTSSFDPLRHGERRRGGRHWGTAMVISAAVLCLLALVAFLIPGSSRHDAPTPTPATAAPGASASPATSPGGAPSATAPPTEVNLRLEAVSAQSWLEVSDDSNHVVLRQILAKGDTKTLTAKALQVKMGNAGAMNLSCNGHKLGTMGAPGQVVTVLVALGDSGDCTVDGATAPAGQRN